jgi:signal transduction histidine kinase
MKHADRLAELLTALFDIRCLEAGVLSISRWPTDLSSVVREVADGMRPTARHVISVSASETVIGEWDERRIGQVVMNLVSNAVKYSPERSTVTVSVTADETTATVRVADEGIGLDGSELTQLFGRGYRAESLRTVRGAGLGLYLSRGLVAAHGGHMWAESVGHGHGSTFCFSLPLHVERGADRVLKERA